MVQPSSISFYRIAIGIILPIFLSFIPVSELWGQYPNKMVSLLQNKQFPAFKKYTDSLSLNTTDINAEWVYLRDLAPSYKEAIFYLEQRIQNVGFPVSYSISKYRVRMIIRKDKIIRYMLSKEIVEQIKGEWTSYFEPLDSFKNDIENKALYGVFKKVFQADLKEEDLFVEDITYGRLCGFAASPPEGQLQVKEWVDKKNKPALIKWLQSANTEKQFYAVDGLGQLKRKGVPLSRKEAKIIRFVKSKMGTMNACFGCFYGEFNIADIKKNKVKTLCADCK